MRTNDGGAVLARLRNEIAVLLHLAGHPNIVQVQWLTDCLLIGDWLVMD